MDINNLENAMKRIPQKISIVIPLYNEEQCVEKTVSEIISVLEPLRMEYELCLVDDGSSDGTLNRMKQLAKEHLSVNWIRFTRNFGHQAALKAGLDRAEGDCVITMDGDLQHPPALLPQMIAAWQEGYDIVATRRKDTGGGNRFKKVTSEGFYRIQSQLTDFSPEPGMADFRLMDRKVVECISALPEVDLFYRGLVAWSGFRTHVIDYEVGERWAGTTKYSLRKMCALAVNGITGFSTRPLYVAIYIGGVVMLSAMIYLGYVLYQYNASHTVWGWTSLMVVLLLMSGIQFMLIGVMGIYLSKIFLQVKQRPVYVVEQISKREKEKENDETME